MGGAWVGHLITEIYCDREKCGWMKSFCLFYGF